jgi:hypothetical protein
VLMLMLLLDTVIAVDIVVLVVDAVDVVVEYTVDTMILQHYEIDISAVVVAAAVLEKVPTTTVPMMKLVEGIRRQQFQAMALSVVKLVDENDHLKVTTLVHLDEEDD